MEERLKSHYESLARAIGFTRAADAKAAPVLVVQVALAGTLAARIHGIWLILTESPFAAESIGMGVVLVIYAISLIASMAFAAWVYIPRNPKTGTSLIYFEDIAAMQPQDFRERAGRMDAGEIERQLLDQVYIVSGIASTKMRLVCWSYWAGGPCVLLWAVLLAWGSI